MPPSARSACPRTTRTLRRALVFSELRFHPGHGQGVQAPAPLPGAHRRAAGRPARARGTIVKESPALALVDAHNGIGTVAAARAMRLAIEKAKVCGIGTVVVRNSTHFGSSAVHACQAADAGCIGIALHQRRPGDGAVGRARRRDRHQPVGHRRAHGPRLPRRTRHRADDRRQGHDAVARARGAADAARLGADAGRARDRRPERRHGRRAAGHRRTTRATGSPS